MLVFVVMIPAGPAFLGPFHAGFRLGLSPFGVPKAAFQVAAIVAHLIQVVVFAVIAGLGFMAAESRVPSSRDESGAAADGGEAG